ncbi:LuxR C-terminal-related transcriptional regulator [Cellulosimicrobium sp. CUA-896]|uniref:helix-turn-helix transcriptional regulator n=1 Tax=Cellulosimicrobium sp. CUA-896 TaxID=1517881 RepID=UPI00095C8A09|nr:LuxR C-terminal-related transcriptional regulator [Cellulosimicrobium sp. CUA-896]OLT53084.1 hypothetical protein BJF88_01620 [Cellulosimicrobium sp. CUA-896]
MDAVSVAVASGRDEVVLGCLSVLALAEACRGRLTRAQEAVDSAAGLVVEAVPPPPALGLARAWVALDRQDLSGAGSALAVAGRSAGPRDAPLLGQVALLLRARLKLDHGDAAGARRLLRRSAAPAEWLRARFEDDVAAVGLLASAAQLDGHRHAGRRPRAAPPAGTATATTVQALLEDAHRHGIRGEHRASREAVARALTLAEGEGLRRPFARAVPEVRSMIRTDPELRSRADWLRPDRRPTRQHEPRRAGDAPVVERLSERELEVLQHLSALLTTEEIAAEMFISANTVRTHVRRILGKLVVSRRHEAVRRARELHLS